MVAIWFGIPDFYNVLMLGFFYAVCFLSCHTQNEIGVDSIAKLL